jgi:hypothetical protein
MLLEVNTHEQAILKLQNVARYIASHYGGTAAHQVIMLCKQELENMIPVTEPHAPIDGRIV